MEFYQELFFLDTTRIDGRNYNHWRRYYQNYKNIRIISIVMTKLFSICMLSRGTVTTPLNVNYIIIFPGFLRWKKQVVVYSGRRIDIWNSSSQSILLNLYLKFFNFLNYCGSLWRIWYCRITSTWSPKTHFNGKIISFRLIKFGKSSLAAGLGNIRIELLKTKPQHGNISRIFNKCMLG